MLNFAFMLLALDCGNTQIKTALIDDLGEVQWRHSAPPGTTLEDLLKSCPHQPDVVVGAASGEKPHWEGVRWMDRDARWPFQIHYQGSIGWDRLLAVTGARHDHPNRDLLVITMGTCMTFNALQSDQYRGGIIAPGLMMRLRAMHVDTQNLPDLSSEVNAAMKEWRDVAVTENTAQSMLRGAIAGTVQQLEAEIEAWKGRLNDPLIILTGGDGMAFANHLKSGIFAASDLELKGLWAQWKYASDSTSN